MHCGFNHTVILLILYCILLRGLWLEIMRASFLTHSGFLFSHSGCVDRLGSRAFPHCWQTEEGPVGQNKLHDCHSWPQFPFSPLPAGAKIKTTNNSGWLHWLDHVGEQWGVRKNNWGNKITRLWKKNMSLETSFQCWQALKQLFVSVIVISFFIPMAWKSFRT